MQRSTKDEILSRLLSANGEPISGQLLADQLMISRTAVWKQIQKLQEEGFTIHTVKKYGYVLTATEINPLNGTTVIERLKTKRYGKNIHVFSEVTSTQFVAHELLEEALDGTVIVAESQTAGRGRMAREWDSAAKKGLWFTTILRPNCLPHEAPQFTLIAAVAIVNAIKSLYPTLSPQIKWPNDLLIGGRKLTGILTEMVAETDRVKALLIGIGINVHHEQEDFPEALQSIATSLKLELEKLESGFVELDRASLLAEILFYLEHYSDVYVKYGFGRIKPLWEEASCTIGQFVRATTLREVIEGKAVSITETGVLQIQQNNGHIVEVYSADIELIKQ